MGVEVGVGEGVGVRVAVNVGTTVAVADPVALCVGVEEGVRLGGRLGLLLRVAETTMVGVPVPSRARVRGGGVHSKGGEVGGWGGQEWVKRV